MGYHDAREIPNYWAYAEHFVLQDRMFGAHRLVDAARAPVPGLGLVRVLPGPERPDELPSPTSTRTASIEQPARRRATPIYAWTDIT